MSVARYTLRASPAVGVGGMYATAQGVRRPVTIDALIPDLVGQQSWAMLPGSIPEEKYRVCWYDIDNNFSFGWGFEGDRLEPEAPLILTDDMDKQVVWYLRKFDAPDGVQNAYTLSAEVEMIGATWYAGTSEEGLVVTKILPIIPDLDPGLIPYWVLDKN